MRFFQLSISFIFLSFLSCGNEELSFYVAQKEAVPGEEVCLEVTAEQFTDILTMQYSMGWDEKILRFTGVQDFGLPGMSIQNFGRPEQHPNRLTLSWFEPNLRAISVPDGSILFSLCFEVIGNSGQGCPVSIMDHPTIVEVANVKEEVLSPTIMEGGVLIK